MIVTQAALNALRRNFNRAFQEGIRGAPSEWNKIATRVPSASAQNIYGWLMKFPQMREWLKGSSRAARSIAEQVYALANKKYESTVDVNREDIEDDNLGMYRPVMQMAGQEAMDHVDRISFGTLDDAYRTTCYDGKSFFATDHPRYAEVDGTGTNDTESNLIMGDLEITAPANKASAGDITLDGGGADKAVGGTFRIQCTTAGASRTAAKFRIAYDDGDYGAEDITLAAGKYAVPNGGVTLAFSNAAFVKGETWTVEPQNPPWYLLHASSMIKPVVYQDRSPAELTTVNALDNDTVFSTDVFRYGIRARRAAGVALWQMAVASTEKLDADGFRTARQRMMEIRWDGGQRTGFRPTLLVVGPSLLADAESTIKAQLGDNGKTNTLWNTVDVCDSTWLR